MFRQNAQGAREFLLGENGLPAVFGFVALLGLPMGFRRRFADIAATAAGTSVKPALVGDGSSLFLFDRSDTRRNLHGYPFLLLDHRCTRRNLRGYPFLLLYHRRTRCSLGRGNLFLFL